MIEQKVNAERFFWRTRLCKWFFLFGVLLVWPAKAVGPAEPSSPENLAVLCRAISGYLQERTPDNEQVEVQVSSVPKNVLAGIKEPVRISCRKRGTISGRTIFTVMSQNPEGTWDSFQVLAVVRRFREVLVLRSDKGRNDLIGAEDFAIERREVVWPNTEVPVTVAEAVGKRTKRWIAKGRVLTQSMLEEVPVIKRGCVVNIQVYAKNLSIVFPAIACEDGRLGEKIRVRNKASGVFYRAEVKDAQTVTYKY